MYYFYKKIKIKFNQTLKQKTMKVKSYVKQALAFITGDTNQVVAEQNFRSADAAVNGQVYAQKAKLVQAEQKLEAAQKALDEAKYPTTSIKDTDRYVNNLVSANNSVELAQEEVDGVKKAIAFFEGLTAEFNTEVEEA